MSDNKVKDFTEIAFSFLSLKVKAIIIGICLGFLIIVIGIFGIIGVFETAKQMMMKKVLLVQKEQMEVQK